MNLSAEVFEQIIAKVKTDACTHDERRSTPRVGIRATATIYLLKDDAKAVDALAVTVRDISAGGIGLIHSAPIKVGARFLMRLARVMDKPLPLVCVVRHCRALAGSTLYAVGAEFQKVAPAAPVEATDVATAQDIKRIAAAILD
jgi:hypothetical protein